MYKDCTRHESDVPQFRLRNELQRDQPRTREQRRRKNRIRLQAGALDLSFTAFHNRISNFIDFLSLCTTATTCAPYLAGTGLSGITTYRQYRNVGSATFWGAEFSGDVKVHRNHGDRRSDLHVRLSHGFGLSRRRAYEHPDRSSTALGSIFTGGMQWQPSRETESDGGRQPGQAIGKTPPIPRSIPERR